MKSFSALRPLFFCLLLAFGFNPSTGYAVTIDDAGAAKLKAMLEDLVFSQTSGLDANGLTLKTDGTVAVEKAQGYYKASLPGYVLTSPEGLNAEIGRIAINATPGDAPGLWKMAIALPTPIRLKGPDQVEITLSIGAQNTSGVWHEDFRNFVKLDSRIENVELSDSKKAFTLSIPSIVSLYDLAEKAPDMWSGPTDIAIKGLTLTVSQPEKPADFMKAAFEEISIKSTIKDMSIKAMSRYREQLEALTANAQTAPNLDASAAHLEAMLKLLIDLFRNAWDGFSGEMLVRGMTIDTPAEGSTPATKVRLEQGNFAMDMGGFRTGKVSVGLRLGHKGLEITPEPAEFGPLAPTLTAFDLRLENLPFQELTDLGLNSMKMAQQTPGMEQMIGLQVLAALPQLMSAAGTKVTLRENRAAGKMYDVMINVDAVANGTAANGVTGKGRVEVAGLDAVIAYLNMQLEKNQGPAREEITSQIGTLTMIQALGQQAKNAAGQDVRTYDLEMNEQGQMLLNGADFNAVMAGRTPPAP